MNDLDFKKLNLFHDLVIIKNQNHAFMKGD